MKTQTRNQLIEIIRKNNQSRPHDLSEKLEISLVAIHRHLKMLIQEGILQKVGSAPHVFYVLKQKSDSVHNPHDFSPDAATKIFLKNNFLYIDPSGNLLEGWNGFYTWAVATKQEKHLSSLVKEYLFTRNEVSRFQKHPMIDATERFQSIFKNLTLDHVYYLDFYSLPKFGKTKLGYLVLHGKQAQDVKLIRQVAQEANPALKYLIHKHKINAIAWAPHSLPRKIQFLKVMEQSLKFNLPRIDLVKAYSGQVPVAQKSLSKLEERIRNASETIFIKSQNISSNKILLIDDAVGSGSTLEETAKKLKARGAKNVIGFAIVGSYKGFEVIREI